MPRAEAAQSGIWHGRCALVTGASSGIGRALASALAANGADLVLTARRQERLDTLADELRGRHDVQVQTCCADLQSPDAPAHIHDATRRMGRGIDILINNAGLLRHGAFAGSNLEDQLAMIRVHCLSLVHLTHLFLPAMISRRSGYILIVATTAIVPAPYVSVYAATKGFDQLFAEGLAEEVAAHHVRVSALCPGPTRTELAIGEHASLQDADDVARSALRGLAEGRSCIHPSKMAWLVANAPRVLPRRTVSGALERFYRPR